MQKSAYNHVHLTSAAEWNQAHRFNTKILTGRCRQRKSDKGDNKIDHRSLPLLILWPSWADSSVSGENFKGKAWQAAKFKYWQEKTNDKGTPLWGSESDRRRRDRTSVILERKGQRFQTVIFCLGNWFCFCCFCCGSSDTRIGEKTRRAILFLICSH